MSATSDLTNAIILAVQQAYPNARLWRMNNGAFRAPSGAYVRVVPKTISPPDIDGWISIRGVAVRLGIEVKRGRDTIKPGQKVYRDQLTAAGGIYIVARSVDQALADLAKIAT